MTLLTAIPKFSSGQLRSASRIVTGSVAIVGLISSGCSSGDGGTAPSGGVTSVNVSTTSVVLQGSGSEQLVSVTLSPANATASVTWRSQNSSVATVVGSGTSATIRAVAPGSTSIIAAVGTIEGTIAITVNPAARRITVSMTTVSLAIGASQPITATLDADPGIARDLVWSSSAPSIATVDPSGTIRAIAQGLATITVSSAAVPSVKTDITVTVNYPAVVVSLSPTTANLLTNATQLLTPTVTAATGVSTALTWSSSAPTVATVSESGVVTALAAGVADIRATSVVNPGASATSRITVSAPVVRSVTLSGNTTAVAGNTVQLTATLDADPGANTTLVWTSSNSAVATVNASGLVTTSAPGNVTITATVTGTTVSGSRVIDVTAPIFPMQWEETLDGVLDPVPTVSTMSGPLMLPDGRTLAVTATAGMYAERSATGVWSARSAPNGVSFSTFVTSPNGTDVWAVANNAVYRLSGSTWVLDAAVGTSAIADISMANDSRGFVVTVNGNVFARSVAGLWSQPPPHPATGFVSNRYVGISTYGGDHAVMVVDEIDGVVRTGNYRIYSYSSGVWSNMGSLEATARHAWKATLLADNTTVLVSAGATMFNYTVYRGTMGSTAWAQEYKDPTGETAPGGAPIVRCADGSLVTHLRRGVVITRVGSTWQNLLGGPSSGSPLPTALACRNTNALVMTDATRGLVGSVINGVSSIERFRAMLNRVSVGSATNVLVSANAAGAALVYNGTGWSAIPVPNESINSSNSPAVVAWGNNGGLLSSVGAVARRTGNTWTWSVQTTPNMGGVTADGSAIYLAGQERRPPIAFGVSAYGSGFQRMTGSTLTDMLPSLLSYTIGKPTLASDGTVATTVTKHQSYKWARVVNGVITLDSVPNGTFLSAALAGSATWTMILTSSIRFVNNRREGDAFVWNNGVYTAVPIVFPGSSESISASAIRGPNEVYVFTNTKRILGFDGNAWHVIGSTARVIWSAEIRGDFGVAVGEDGTVVYGRLTPSSVPAVGRCALPARLGSRCQ